MDRYDILARGPCDSQPWEIVLLAARGGRKLTRDELDGLGADDVRAAFAHGLVEEGLARRRIQDIHDEARERSWYEG